MSKEIKLNEWTKARTNKQINKMKTTKKAQTKQRKKSRINEWTNKQKKGKNERRREGLWGGNEDELMSCWQTLFTLSGEMTEGRSYRKKHKDERLLCRLLIWLCSKFAPSRPTWEEHVGTSEKVEQCRSKKGVLERGRAIFWALTEQALPSPHPIPPSRFPPFPENSLYHTLNKL